MNETPSHRNADPARAGQTRTHGGMWAMWICCLALLLLLLVSFFWR